MQSPHRLSDDEIHGHLTALRPDVERCVTHFCFDKWDMIEAAEAKRQEDLFQEAMIVAWKAMCKWSPDGDATVETYALSAVRNYVFHVLRAAGVHLSVVVPVRFMEKTNDMYTDPDDSVRDETEHTLPHPSADFSTRPDFRTEEAVILQALAELDHPHIQQALTEATTGVKCGLCEASHWRARQHIRETIATGIPHQPSQHRKPKKPRRTGAKVRLTS